MEKNLPKKGLLTISEISEVINLSVSHIYKMVAKKKIPHYRLDSKILFNKEEIEKWVQERKVPVE